MPQSLDSVRFSQNCVAKALYDNIAESPDELPFRKGDLLTVLEQNTAGLEGWWLCSLRGRQGICPGNRLRLLAGVYDSGQRAGEEFSVHEPRRSWQSPPNKVVTPQKVGDVYLYDSPVTRVFDSRYDVLPSSQPIPIFDHAHLRGFSQSLCNSRPESSGSSSGYGIAEDAHELNAQMLMGDGCSDANNRYDTPRWPPARIQNNSVDSYDVLRPMHTNDAVSPCSSDSSLVLSANGSRCSSNRSSFAPDYDVPRPRPVTPEKLRERKLLMAYDVLPSTPQPRELPLELNSAIENLERLETEVTSAINKLLSYVGPSWRQPDKMQPKLMDVKLAVLRLRSALHDLFNFSEGVLGNALNAPDKGLAQNLRPLTRALYQANNVIQEAAKKLNDRDWSIDELGITPSNYPTYLYDIEPPLDPLDEIICCARCMTVDVREFASFVQGNATILFKRHVPENETFRSRLGGEESDYVNLEKHKTLRSQHADVRCSLPQEMQKSYDLLIKESENGELLSEEKYTQELDHSDKKVLSFYSAQCTTHSLYLTHAIDAFLNCVEHNQPPKIFLAHGKFVILSAHRLVHIGDTVHQNVTCPEISAKVLQLSNALSEGLAATVHKIKQAAMQFPSVSAVQEMVDSVVDVSHLARDLKLCIVISSQQSQPSI